MNYKKLFDGFTVVGVTKFTENESCSVTLSFEHATLDDGFLGMSITMTEDLYMQISDQFAFYDGHEVTLDEMKETNVPK